MKKLKKKELIILLENKKDENKILLEMIQELKLLCNQKPKEKIIYIEKNKTKLSKKEKRHQAKIDYLKKRFLLTRNKMYQNELNKY